MPISSACMLVSNKWIGWIPRFSCYIYDHLYPEALQWLFMAMLWISLIVIVGFIVKKLLDAEKHAIAYIIIGAITFLVLLHIILTP